MRVLRSCLLRLDFRRLAPVEAALTDRSHSLFQKTMDVVVHFYHILGELYLGFRRSATVEAALTGRSHSLFWSSQKLSTSSKFTNNCSATICVLNAQCVRDVFFIRFNPATCVWKHCDQYAGIIMNVQRLY